MISRIVQNSVESLLVTTVLLTFAIEGAAPAFALEGEPATQFILNGLKSVHVSVDSLRELKQLDRSAIKSSVESQLQQSGMKIIGEKEFLNYSDVSRFLVKVIPLKHNNQMFYSLRVALTQMVFLEEKEMRRVPVTVWQDEVVGVVEKKSQDQITKRISERVDGFIDIWQRSNETKKDDF